MPSSLTFETLQALLSQLPDPATIPAQIRVGVRADLILRHHFSQMAWRKPDPGCLTRVELAGVPLVVDPELPLDQAQILSAAGTVLTTLDLWTDKP